MPSSIHQQLCIHFPEGWSKAVFMQFFLSWPAQEFAPAMWCRPLSSAVAATLAFFYPLRQAAKFNSDLPQWCMRAAIAEISLMIPLSEHTEHKLLVRLTTANSVIISSQETSEKSAIGNAALSLSSAEFSLQISVLSPSTRLPSTFLLELLGDYTDIVGIGSKK